MMSEGKKEKGVTIEEQIGKYHQSIFGFNTMLILGAGCKIGIFDYLYEKGKSSTQDKITSITFTPEEIILNLKLSPFYLDGWLHMAVACGIFELEDSCERCLISAPHIYDLFINRDSMFYKGNTAALMNIMALNQEFLINNFKTGNTKDYRDFPPEDCKNGQVAIAIGGAKIEQLFSNRKADFQMKFMNNGLFLEVGCGYGFNLEAWVKKYEKVKFVGIDIDPNGIAEAKKLIQKKGWEDRVELIEVSVSDYAKTNSNKFDLIMLKQVLHEMDSNENYRRQALEDIYTMLKDDGILIIGENMIPDLFKSRNEVNFLQILHKMLDLPFGSRFYDDDTFKELIYSTSFKKAEKIEGDDIYFWAITK